MFWNLLVFICLPNNPLSKWLLITSLIDSWKNQCGFKPTFKLHCKQWNVRQYSSAIYLINSQIYCGQWGCRCRRSSVYLTWRHSTKQPADSGCKSSREHLHFQTGRTRHEQYNGIPVLIELVSQLHCCSQTSLMTCVLLVQHLSSPSLLRVTETIIWSSTGGVNTSLFAIKPLSNGRPLKGQDTHQQPHSDHCTEWHKCLSAWTFIHQAGIDDISYMSKSIINCSSCHTRNISVLSITPLSCSRARFCHNEPTTSTQALDYKTPLTLHCIQKRQAIFITNTLNSQEK